MAEDRNKRALSTKEGNSLYKPMPFGLKTAPATFHSMMSVVLSGIKSSRCFLFLDDIYLYAKSLADQNNKIRVVFDKFMENNLKLKTGKCKFLRKEDSYLGHVISEKGGLPNKTKTKETKEFPTPNRKKPQILSLVNDLL